MNANVGSKSKSVSKLGPRPGAVSVSKTAEAGCEERLRRKLMRDDPSATRPGTVSASKTAEARFEERLRRKLTRDERERPKLDSSESTKSLGSQLSKTSLLDTPEGRQPRRIQYQMTCRSCKVNHSNLKYAGNFTTSEVKKELKGNLRAHYRQVYDLVQDGFVYGGDSSSIDFPSSSLARHVAKHCLDLSSEKEVIEWCMKNIRVEIKQKTSFHFVEEEEAKPDKGTTRQRSTQLQRNKSIPPVGNGGNIHDVDTSKTEKEVVEEKLKRKAMQYQRNKSMPPRRVGNEGAVGRVSISTISSRDSLLSRKLNGEIEPKSTKIMREDPDRRRSIQNQQSKSMPPRRFMSSEGLSNVAEPKSEEARFEEKVRRKSAQYQRNNSMPPRRMGGRQAIRQDSNKSKKDYSLRASFVKDVFSDKIKEKLERDQKEATAGRSIRKAPKNRPSMSNSVTSGSKQRLSSSSGSSKRTLMRRPSQDDMVKYELDKLSRRNSNESEIGNRSKDDTGISASRETRNARQKYIEREELDIFEARIRSKNEQDNQESIARWKPSKSKDQPSLQNARSLRQNVSRRKLLDDKLDKHRASLRMSSTASRDTLQRELSFSYKLESFSDRAGRKIDSRKSSFAASTTEASSVRSNDRNISVEEEASGVVESWDDLEAVLKQTAAMSAYCDPSSRG